MQETGIQKKLKNQEIDYLKIVKILLSRWYLVVASVLIAVLIAYAYLWYTPKTYATSGIIKFEEKKSEMSDLINVMSNSGRNTATLQSERYIIQSRSLLLSAIKNLDYRISFYISGRVRTHDVYPKKPLQINILKFDSLNFYQDLIAFKPVDKNTFNLSWKVAGNDIRKNFTYNAPVNIGPVAFSISYPGQMNPDAEYMFKFNVPENYLARVGNGLWMNEAAKNSNIVNIQQTDSNPQFAADILNAILKEYLDYDRSQKTKSATQMIQFINDQLQYLSTEVKGSERSLEKYKQNSRILDVSSSAGLALSKVTELEAQRALLKIQLIAIDQLKKQLSEGQENISLNFNMEGSVDPLLGILLGNLNTLLADKNALLKTYNSSAQPIADINQQILQLKNSALQNINASNQRIQKNMDFLDAQLAKANQQVSGLPAVEKDMISLSRDFEINQKVYSFLSEKQLEAQINRSAILPGATIIEQAQLKNIPVSPIESEIYRTAITLGLLAGIVIIVLIRILNPYIYDKESVENVTTVPIIGVIRKFPDKVDEDNSQILALSKPRSIFAESVRAIRTNLNFLASEKESKVICITSEVSGEGKSFTALNLSSTLALIEKKVILIGADLRRPKLHKTFGAHNNKGLSNYLVNQCSIEEIIQHLDHNNFDFISSGPIPPNPSELLHSERMHDLLNELKERYQVVMIDTAPIGLVSDSIPLIRWSDINLFVIRYGKSKHHAATMPERIAKEYQLSNMVIVLNAFEENRLHSGLYRSDAGYGTRYTDYSGYENSGYYVDGGQLKWWNIRRWFKS